jgi:hypothetical protein
MDVDNPVGGELNLSSVDKVKLLAKVYCHGGDVAFFGTVDLEYEAHLNHLMYGYSTKKHQSVVSTDMNIESAGIADRLCSRLGGCAGDSAHASLYKYGAAFVEGVTTCTNSFLILILRLLLEHPGRSRGALPLLLDVIRGMRDTSKAPLRFTEKWERLVIDQLGKIAR